MSSPPHPPLPEEALCGPFTPYELRVARTKLKTGKGTGDDGISNEFLRLVLLTTIGFSLILSLINGCWVNEEVPGEWWVARIFAIYKGKKLPIDLPPSYRPIALLQTMYKLFTKMIELRFSPYLYIIQEYVNGNTASYRACRLIAQFL